MTKNRMNFLLHAKAQNDMGLYWLNRYMFSNYGALSEIISGEYKLTHMNAERNIVSN